MRKFIWMVLLLPLMMLAQAPTNMYENDASDQSKPMMRSIYMTICHAIFGTHHGLYLKSYQRHEKHQTCEELAPQFEHVTINPYSASKRKSGNAGGIGFGKSPHQCQLELKGTSKNPILIQIFNNFKI